MKKFFLLIALFLILTTYLFAKDVDQFKGTWLCIEDKAIGFNWNRNTSTWENVEFEVEKYIFKTTSDDDCQNKLPYDEICGAFYRFGTTPLFNFPAKVSNYINQSQLYISSTNGANEFEISDTGNFIIFNKGWASDKGLTLKDETNLKNAMKIGVGKCSKI